jgi:hypothetical protein
VENSNTARADFDATITRENAISNSLGGERCSVPRENRASNNFRQWSLFQTRHPSIFRRIANGI